MGGRWRGFTLAESLTASVVLAASVVALSSAMSASYQQSAQQDETTVALDLARELMEEIASKPIAVTAPANDYPGWSSGQHDRTTYDTVDDYNGYLDTSSAIAMADGTTIDAGNGDIYTRMVSVQSNALPSGLTGTASDFSLVTVTVMLPHGQRVAISQLMTKTMMVR
jgi:type II secretory pathway pseudopilin PulG